MRLVHGGDLMDQVTRVTETYFRLTAEEEQIMSARSHAVVRRSKTIGTCLAARNRVRTRFGRRPARWN